MLWDDDIVLWRVSSDFNSSNIMSTLCISQIIFNSSFFFCKGSQFLHSRTIIFTLTCNFFLSNAKFRHIQFLACYHDSVIECNLLQSCNIAISTRGCEVCSWNEKCIELSCMRLVVWVVWAERDEVETGNSCWIQVISCLDWLHFTFYTFFCFEEKLSLSSRF